jgi:hypothetical protein
MDPLTCPVAVFNSPDVPQEDKRTYTFTILVRLQVLNGDGDLHSIDDSLDAGKLGHKIGPVFVTANGWRSLLTTTKCKSSVPVSGTESTKNSWKTFEADLEWQARDWTWEVAILQAIHLKDTTSNLASRKVQERLLWAALAVWNGLQFHRTASGESLLSTLKSDIEVEEVVRHWNNNENTMCMT